MVLEELHELIETLQARITEHGPALGQSEALTRYALIDPLLRGLGWDTGDPSQIRVEVRFGSGSADYALLGEDGKPRVIVEAKKLGTPLQNAVNQGINYSIEDGILHFALTDGQRWELYETHRPVPLAEKLVIKLDVKGSVAETCLNALALWRPSVQSGKVRPAATPVVGKSQNLLATDASTTQPVEPVGQPLGDGWQSLSGFAPKAGDYPDAIRLPSGTEIGAKWWGPFNEAIVRYLSEQGDLTAAHMPIRNGSGRYVLALKADPPKGPQGQPVKNLRDVDEFLLNTNFQAAANASNARLIIQHAGLDPADFAVKLQ